jgi:dipeptidyl aminopeptidase/acylaminoacyl peptidase
MIVDLRDHPLYKTAEELTADWLRPGSGEAATIGQIKAAPDGRRAVAAALICDALEGVPSTRIALIDLASGDLTLLTHGPRSDSAPQWSPDGRLIAYLSDREQAHANRLRLLDPESGEDWPTPEVSGFVEYVEWSADGATILLGVAGYGSDLAGAQGAFAVNKESGGCERPAWAPTIAGNPEATPWRSLWRYDLASNSVQRITHDGLNVWQAAWCGGGRIAAICSDQPGETWWYSADVRLIDPESGADRRIFGPEDQLGWLAASPCGSTVAVVEAVCSDRNVVAGDLRLIDVESGAVDRPATLDADIVQVHWRDAQRLLFAAVHGPDTLVGMLDSGTGACRQLWRSQESSLSGAMYPEIAPIGDGVEDFLFVQESFFDAPRLIALEDGREREVQRFGSAKNIAEVNGLGSARDVSWVSPDGLAIHGWLLTPPSAGPFPVIMQIHGGPVWHSRPSYLGRSAFAQMALAAGYALFQPNPRGSSGRGQAFARRVFGDMGGADAHDYLSGLDALANAGVIDPKRIGVTGGSYGGYMSSWLITQDQRFAAAIPVAPVSNWVSQHFTCNISQFGEMFLSDKVSNPTGKYFTRSPVHFADRARTPTLQICGALDRITPPGQALEFHQALQLAGVESVVLTYPREGHGIRNMPAMFDYAARMLMWFTKHMPPS